MLFQAPPLCQWARYVSSEDRGTATQQFLEDCQHAAELCEDAFGDDWTWFCTPNISSNAPKKIPAAKKIENGWFSLPRVSQDMIFHYKNGRLDAFFTSKDASAKFQSMRCEGSYSQLLCGFCITKDLAKTSCFPSSNTAYWSAAIDLVEDLDALCLVTTNKTVATISQEQSYVAYSNGGDFLGAFWDFPSEIGCEVSLAVIRGIVESHTKKENVLDDEAGEKIDEAFEKAKRSRLMITLGEIIEMRETLEDSALPQVSREYEAAMRKTLTDVDHLVLCSGYYYQMTIPSSLKKQIRELLEDAHHLLDDCRLVTHPGAPVPLAILPVKATTKSSEDEGNHDTESDTQTLEDPNQSPTAALPQQQNKLSFLISPLHTFNYESRAPKSELIAYDAPSPQSLSFNPREDDWYTMRDKMRSVLTYAQQLFNSTSEHVGNGKRLAFEVIAHFVLNVLPLPTPHHAKSMSNNNNHNNDRNKNKRGYNTKPHQRRCFWFDQGSSSQYYDQSIRKDIVDILFQLLFTLKMCPQATIGNAMDDADGTGREKKEESSEANGSSEQPKRPFFSFGQPASSWSLPNTEQQQQTTTTLSSFKEIVATPIFLSSTAQVVFVCVLAVTDAVLRVLFPRDLEALRIAYEDGDSPQSILDMTRVLNGIPWELEKCEDDENEGEDDDAESCTKKAAKNSNSKNNKNGKNNNSKYNQNKADDGEAVGLAFLAAERKGVDSPDRTNDRSAKGKVIVPSIAPLLSATALNLSAPHLLMHVRTCHAYFTSVQPNEELEPLIGCDLERIEMTSSYVRQIIDLVMEPYYCTHIAKTKSIRPSLFPHLGTACAEYLFQLDNCYAFISGISEKACNYLPSYEITLASSSLCAHPSWAPSPNELTVRGGFFHQGLTNEMDVIHVRQLTGEINGSADCIERIAAAITERGVSLRVILSLISSSPRLLESDKLYSILALLISSSPQLSLSTNLNSGKAADDSDVTPSGVGASTAVDDKSVCGPLIEEVLAYPEEFFSIVHKMLKEAVASGGGAAFDSQRARMLCRAVFIVVQIIEIAIFILETDPSEPALACPCTYVDGVTGTHADRRAALSVQAKYAFELLLAYALPLLQDLIKKRESMAKPTAELFPDSNKLAAALTDFRKRHADLCHIHNAVLAITSLCAHNQCARWLFPEVVLPPNATMRSSCDLFWTAETIVSNLDIPLFGDSPAVKQTKKKKSKKAESEKEKEKEGQEERSGDASDGVSLADVVVAGAASAAYSQNMDMTSALEILNSNSTAVDFLCRNVHKMTRVVAMVVRAAQDVCCRDFRSAKRSRVTLTKTTSALFAASAAAVISRIANEIIASSISLGLVLREETGELIVKERDRYARFISSGGQWGATPGSKKRQRFLLKAVIDRTKLSDANMDLAKNVTEIKVNVEIMRPTLPVSNTVTFGDVVSNCFPSNIVENLTESGEPLSCIVPLVSIANRGPNASTVSCMGRLVIHSTPPVIHGTQTFKCLPSKDSASETRNYLKRIADELTNLGPESKKGASKIAFDSCITRGDASRMELKGSTDELGTFVADCHLGCGYFSRDSVVVSSMKRLGDIAYAHPTYSSNLMFRSIKAFNQIENFYLEDGEAALKKFFAHNGGKTEAFLAQESSELPTYDPVSWPAHAFQAQRDVISLKGSEKRSTSISRPLPLWLATAIGQGGGGGDKSSSVSSSRLYEMLLPHEAVASMVPTPIQTTHVWFMLVSEEETLHRRVDGKQTEDSEDEDDEENEANASGSSSASKSVIHGYPIPSGLTFHRATHVLNWLEEHLFALEPAQRDSFTFIKIESDATLMTATVSKQELRAGGSEETRTCVTTDVLVSPYAPALSNGMRRLFSHLCRIVPLNEIIPWKKSPNAAAESIKKDGAVTATAVAVAAVGAIASDDLCEIISIPCANLVFVRAPSNPTCYECQQYPEFLIDLEMNSKDRSIPEILLPFSRGIVPFGTVLKSKSGQRFALLMPVVDARNGYAAVELINLTASGDDFIPPTPECAACLLMCLYRHCLSPMNAVPTIRSAFVNAGNFSPTQKMFLKNFVFDLWLTYHFGAVHNVIDELDACCPTYAKDLSVSRLVYDTDEYIKKYFVLGYVRGVQPQLRMNSAFLSTKVSEIASRMSSNWEKETFLDEAGLLLSVECISKRLAYPFGAFSSSFAQYWHLTTARVSSVDSSSVDDLGHEHPRTAVHAPASGGKTILDFVKASNLDPATLIGFLKLRVAFSSFPLFFSFEALSRLLSFRDAAEAEQRGRMVQNMKIKAFIHEYTTQEWKKVPQTFTDRRGNIQTRYVDESYDVPRTRTAFMNKTAVRELEQAALLLTVRQPPEQKSRVYFREKAFWTMSLPSEKMTHFVGGSQYYYMHLVRITVNLKKSGITQPFGGAVADTLATFPESVSGRITVFDELPYSIGSNDEVAQLAIAKQQSGLKAFRNLSSQALVRTCPASRIQAVKAFTKLRDAIGQRLEEMSSVASSTRASMLEAERKRVRASESAQPSTPELHQLGDHEVWVTTGALLRKALCNGDGEFTDKEVRDLVFSHVFASHAAVMLADLLVQVKTFIKKIVANRVAESLSPQETEAGEGLLRVAGTQRVYVDQTGASATFNPFCLYFEWSDLKILRDTQYGLLEKIWKAMIGDKDPAEVHQLLMGEGKSSVIIPILALQLCTVNSLMIVSCPNQLVRAAEKNLLATTLGPLTVDLFKLSVNREKDLVQTDLDTILAMKARGGVILAAPNTLKCIFSLNPLDIAKNPRDAGNLEVYASAIQLLKSAPLILDEVDDTCDPLRSSLVFPCGAKERLHHADLRWRLPTLLLHTLHASSRLILLERSRILPREKRAATAGKSTAASSNVSDEALSTALPSQLQTNSAIFPDIRALIDSIGVGLTANQITLAPHLLLSTDDAFWQFLLDPLKPVVASILSLPDVAGVSLPRKEIEALLVEERPVALQIKFDTLCPLAKCAINLATEWLYSLLPHILRKQHRVQFGVINPSDEDFLKKRAIAAGQDPYMQVSRTILAVPFEGKDQPSPSSEFSHPDIVIGLTITAHVLSPLVRDRDAGCLIQRLKVALSADSAPLEHRDAYKKFNAFMLEGLSIIIGSCGHVASALYRRIVEKFFGGQAPTLPISHKALKPVLEDLGTLERVSDSHYAAADVYDVLRNSVSAACYFCVDISSEYLRLNPFTFTACGGDLLSSVTFHSRIGFSGTASDMIPHEVKKGCQHQAESEGKASSVLLCDKTTSLCFPQADTIEGQVEASLAAALTPFNAIIDVGAMLTKSNEEVASWLLSILPKTIKGCVFFKRDDSKVALMRDTGAIFPLEVAGLKREEQFVFYDQLHTRGQDVKQHPTARALVLVGMKGDLDLNSLAQGVFRMRGLGAGQTLTLMIPREVCASIKSMCECGEIVLTPPSSPANHNAPNAATLSEGKRDNPSSSAITNSHVHAWALCNLLRQTRIARVALKFENARRLLAKPLIEYFKLKNAGVYSSLVADVYQEPVGFHLSDGFAPKHQTVADNCQELFNRFQKVFYVDYAEAVEYIAQIKSSSAAAAAEVANGNGKKKNGKPSHSSRELDALMEKDQQEFKVKEKEVAKVVNVQDNFSREGELYTEWDLRDVIELFGLRVEDIDGTSYSDDDYGEENEEGECEESSTEGEEDDDEEYGLNDDEPEEEEEGNEDDEEYSSIFPSLPRYMINCLQTKKAGVETEDADKLLDYDNDLVFSPNFYPYSHEHSANRRVRPINFVLEVVYLGKTQVAGGEGGSRDAADDDDDGEDISFVRFSDCANTAMQHQSVAGKPSSVSKAATIASLAVLGDTGSTEGVILPEPYKRRRFIVLTLAEAVRIRRIIEKANARGEPALAKCFALAIRDFNLALIPAYRENAFVDDVPDTVIRRIAAITNFIEGNPLFSVLFPRAKIDPKPAKPNVKFPLLTPPPLYFLQDSSASYLVMLWLGRFTTDSRVVCFSKLSRELRRPDASKLDWRLHSGARYTLTKATDADEVLTARVCSAELLLTARARNLSLADLQRILDPSMINFASLEAFADCFKRVGLSLSKATVSSVYELLDYNVDGRLGWEDLHRAVTAFEQSFAGIEHL